MPQPSAEKRLKTRYPVKVPVMVRLENDKGVVRGLRAWKNAKMDAVSSDLSAGGMRLELEKPLEVGTLSQFELVLSPKLHPVSVFARVVWATAQSAGLQFLIMNDRHRTLLEAFLKMLASKPEGLQGRAT